MNKYIFKPYSKIFPQLFDAEKKRIACAIQAPAVIEHIGSTAVPNLGGKGIIDIAIAVDKNAIENVSKQLKSIGYEFRPSFSTSERLYFVIHLPDPEEGTRRYHVHLTYPTSSEWMEFLDFRDRLRNHPEEARKYGDIKKQAALESNQDGKMYRELKAHIFHKSHVKTNSSTKNIFIDTTLVHRLISTQFPKWKDLPVQPIAMSGWDNRTFHLGSEMLVRLPSAAKYAAQVEKEHLWLPKLSPLLPLPVPKPIALGHPTNEYPWKWSIYRYLEGNNAAQSPPSNLSDFAKSLAQFLVALQHIDGTGGPPPSPDNFYRGGYLRVYDAQTRQAIHALKDRIDTHTATKVWEAALETSWQHTPVWVHGDISLGNLLVQNGKLSAVIDFGQLAVGDPACDLSIAWTLFKEKSRDVFRSLLPLDSDTWTRGRAWTLWKALITANDRIIDEVLNSE